MRIVMFGLALLVLTGCGVVSKNIQESATTSTGNTEKSLSVQANIPDTPLAIYSWINSHIRYQAHTDTDPEYRTAAETLTLGYGDCSDFAVLADSMLKQHGYTSEVVSVYTATQGHTVCVWKDAQGTYDHLSNKTYREIHAPDLKTIAADVYADWNTLVTYPDNNYETRS